MTWSLNVSGAGAPAADVKAAAGDAFRALAELAGATGGSLSGTEAGEPISVSYPEPAAATDDAGEDPASSPD